MLEQETRMNGNRERYVDLVFEGGGVKGIALVGAFSVLEERGYEPQNMAGASAGAIVAALIAAGYSSVELRKSSGNWITITSRTRPGRIGFPWQEDL